MKTKDVIIVRTNLEAFGDNEKKRRKHVKKIGKVVRQILKQKRPVLIHGYDTEISMMKVRV